jgi:integrase
MSMVVHRKKLPRFVERWRDRHGKLRTYGRKDRHGPRIPLPDYGTPEFDIAYAKMIIDELEPAKPRRLPPAAGTLGALILSYQESEAYRALRPTTKDGYRSRINALLRDHGHRTVAGLDQDRIEKGILRPYTDRPGAKLAILKMLRVLIRHAIKKRLLRSDPSFGIDRPEGGRVRAWTDGEIEQFEKRWRIGTKQRLAFALMLYTGQRRSDVHRMTWADVSGTTIKVVQQKTDRKLILPLHRDLRSVLARTERKHVTIVNTAFGRPFTVDGFSRFMRDAISAAGLPLECQPHGLRKAAGRRLAEAGCTANEIMAVLGHVTLEQAEEYTRDADQARLASAAVMKLERTSSERGLPKPPARPIKSLGKAAKRKGTSI